MENIALSRRNFIKLLGAGSLTTLTGIGLTGCAIPNDTNDIQSIDFADLKNHDIVICDYFQNTRCVITDTCTTTPFLYTFYWFRLYLPGDPLKYSTFSRTYDSYDKAKNAFDKKFHTIERINLQNVMIDEYSFKDSYTATEISAVATKIEEEYNKTKEEEGNSYTKSL